MWIGGRSSNGRPGGDTRLGPANDTGLARLDQLGSVRMLMPSSWIKRVACPAHVTVAAPRLSRMVGRSLAIDGSAALRGAKVVDHILEMKNVKRVQKLAGSDDALTLANPFWRGWAGAPGPRPPARRRAGA